LFFEHKSLLANKCEVPDGDYVEELGKAKVLREGKDITVIALAAMVPRALKAAEILAAEHGVSATVVDVRSLVPLDTQTLLRESARTGRVFTVEENPRLCGWGAEISSIIHEECFSALKQPVIRITTPHIPLPSSDQLEDAVIPTSERIVAEIRKTMAAKSKAA
jgi:acetoin:2,6-dichlorophenolindophenol oxidoreductase subunit beta